MNCLYCNKEIKKITYKSVLYETDLLCPDCRKEMKNIHRTVFLEDLEVEVFYDYDSLFKTLLLQYKECYDEALAPIFLYGYEDRIRWKYRDYAILYVPSTMKKIQERGFHHLKEIFSVLNLEEVQGLSQKEQLVQEGKDFRKREKMKDNYLYSGPCLSKVLIVDDMMTTGSSLLGIYRTIKPYAKKVKALSLGIKIPNKK